MTSGAKQYAAYCSVSGSIKSYVKRTIINLSCGLMSFHNVVSSLHLRAYISWRPRGVLISCCIGCVYNIMFAYYVSSTCCQVPRSA